VVLAVSCTNVANSDTHICVVVLTVR